MNRKIKTSFLLLFVLLSWSSMAQDLKEQRTRFNIGFGTGLDYGEFGGRFSYLPSNRLVSFLGVGTKGYNFGGLYRITPRTNSIVLGGMYGYNYYFPYDGGKTYNGFSLVIGAEFRRFPARPNPENIDYSKRRNFLSIELLLPFYSPDVDIALDALSHRSIPVYPSHPGWAAMSIGWHFGF